LWPFATALLRIAFADDLSRRFFFSEIAATVQNLGTPVAP
jgi:hypothetical protein